jgi:hypothetical protein
VIRALRLTGQFIVVAALFAAVAAFSNWPRYSQIPDADGVILLSFVHGADRKASCRKLSPEEIARLPPNMRKPLDCPRRRPPVYVELDVGERTLYRALLQPGGIAGDGPSKVYERFSMPAGDYALAVRMRDTPRKDGFDYEDSRRLSLAPGQQLVIDFSEETKHFLFR